MAIAIDHTSLDFGDTTPTLVSPSYTPGAAGHLAVIFILHSGSTVGSEVTGITGSCIGTATQHVFKRFATVAAPVLDIEIWSALTTGSAGALTVTLPSSPTGMKATLTEFTGVDTAQGTNGVITTNKVTNFSDTNGTALAATLGAFSNVANGAVMIAANTALTDFTTGAGWTRISGNGYSTPNCEEAAYWSATNNTAVAATAATSAQWGVAAIEIAGLVATKAPPPQNPVRRLLPILVR